MFIHFIYLSIVLQIVIKIFLILLINNIKNKIVALSFGQYKNISTSEKHIDFVLSQYAFSQLLVDMLLWGWYILVSTSS
jgi:hypothetical protein